MHTEVLQKGLRAIVIQAMWLLLCVFKMEKELSSWDITLKMYLFRSWMLEILLKTKIHIFQLTTNILLSNKASGSVRSKLFTLLLKWAVNRLAEAHLYPCRRSAVKAQDKHTTLNKGNKMLSSALLMASKCIQPIIQKQQKSMELAVL